MIHHLVLTLIQTAACVDGHVRVVTIHSHPLSGWFHFAPFYYTVIDSLRCGNGGASW